MQHVEQRLSSKEKADHDEIRDHQLANHHSILPGRLDVLQRRQKEGNIAERIDHQDDQDRRGGDGQEPDSFLDVIIARSELVKRFTSSGKLPFRLTRIATRWYACEAERTSRLRLQLREDSWPFIPVAACPVSCILPLPAC